MLGGSLEKREHKLVIKWRFNFKWKISKLSFVVFSRFSSVWLFATLWTVDHQAPLPMGFSRREYWSGMPCPSWGNGPNLGTESVSPCLLHFRQILHPLRHWDASLFVKIYIYLCLYLHMGFLFGTNGDKLTCQCRRPKRCSWISGLQRSSGEGNGNPLQYLPRESHGQRNLVGYSPWSCKESDTTEVT